MIGAVILASDPPLSRNNGEQLELLSPAFLLESAVKPFFVLALRQVVLVLGRDYHRVLNMLPDLPPHFKVVIHRRPERGMGAVLSAGIQSLPDDLRGILVARGDQVVEQKTIEKLLTAFHQEDLKEKSKKRIVVSMHHGKRGFPWVVSSHFRKELGHFEGELSLKAFLASHRKEVLPVAANGV